MKTRDYQDLIGGGLLIVVGLFAALYAQQYETGTLARMGPGFFPTSLGILLAILGGFIFVPALFRQGVMPEVQWRNLILVMGGIIAFALTLRTLGLIVACIVTVIITSLADRETTWRLRLVLSVVIMLMTVGIFKIGLGMVIPLWWGE